MLRDLGDALLQPRRFFGALAARSPSAARAFLALLLPFAIAVLVQALRVDALLAEPAARDALARSGLSAESLRTSFVVGILSVAPIAALSAWGVGWLPLRMGAGRFARIGEVAAWTQLPVAVGGLLSMVASALGAAPAPALSLALQVAVSGWCGWLVYEALRVFSPRTLRGGLIAYAVFCLAGIAFNVGFGLVSRAGGGAGDGLVF